MAKPVVALVGRPNVGKSTLFNRLAEERLAVVDDVPGTTRDRIMGEAEWAGITFNIIDTGGIDPTQTGPGRGKVPLSVGSSEFIEQIRAQAETAIREADAILFLTDAGSGVTPADKEVAQILRRMQVEDDGKLIPPVFLVVNKSDNPARRQAAYEFYELGLGDPYPISSMHGTGTGDLLDDLVATFKERSQAEEDETVNIAIVGKPNVGKSSLLNHILGEERAIVSAIPGTTRDAIDTNLIFDGVPVTLIDTAGIRKRGKVEPGVEKWSVLRSMQAIERADVSLLVVDATSGLTAQDAHIAGYILEKWKSTVVVVNKWDAIPKDNTTMDEFTRHVRQTLNFLPYVPVLYISALTGQRVEQVLPLALKVQEERLVRLSTSQVNSIMQKAQEQHPAPSHAGRQLKIFYSTQVRSDPPTFILYVNDPKLVHFSYQRYLENRFRESYSFVGTPIRFVLKARR
ncbi:MAG: ribosome biogenesis GTPase Der [Chloroflexi bacterium]|nr:MAG: ribosome biogenesis GTPase Der [Chloroflexota bacterium]